LDVAKAPVRPPTSVTPLGSSGSGAAGKARFERLKLPRPGGRCRFVFVAHGNLDDLVDRLRRLPPDKLGRVTRVVEALEAEGPGARDFERLCGVIPKPEADAMMAAIADCERVDTRDW
jgi:hypothetical protein